MKTAVIESDEYVASDSSLAFMLNYWCGWWRIIWHWHDKSVGLTLPSLRMVLAHRKYCEAKCRDKIGFSFALWRLSICFNCETIEEMHARHRAMFSDDIWPVVILEDILDAEYIED